MKRPLVYVLGLTAALTLIAGCAKGQSNASGPPYTAWAVDHLYYSDLVDSEWTQIQRDSAQEGNVALLEKDCNDVTQLLIKASQSSLSAPTEEISLAWRTFLINGKSAVSDCFGDVSLAREGNDTLLGWQTLHQEFQHVSDEASILRKLVLGSTS